MKPQVRLLVIAALAAALGIGLWAVGLKGFQWLHQRQLSVSGLPPMPPQQQRALGSASEPIPVEEGQAFRLGPLAFSAGWRFVNNGIVGLIVARDPRTAAVGAPHQTFVTLTFYQQERHLGIIECSSYAPLVAGPPTEMFCPPSPARLVTATRIVVADSSLVTP